MPCRGPSARPGSGPWPSALPYRRPVPMKTSMSPIFIFVSPLAAWVRGQPVDDRPRTHACERPHTQRAVPLISGHQRPAAAGDFRPPDHLRTGARHPCPQQLAQPRTTRDHQQGNGRRFSHHRISKVSTYRSRAEQILGAVSTGTVPHRDDRLTITEPSREFVDGATTHG